MENNTSILQKIKNKTLIWSSNSTLGYLSKKINADNFSFKEYERLVKALGCNIEINIILPNGNKI